MDFNDWKNYFETNQTHFANLDWDAADLLASEEKTLIASSIKQFQKGENSEGKNLMQYARQWGDIDYLQTIKLFIKEEQQHALVLGKFMAKHGIDKLRSHWTDTVFRRLRKLGSLENSVMVLITAEIIAAVYYKALKRVTDSVLLRSICKQILIDELMHINFQSYTLRQFYLKRSTPGKMSSRLIHRLLMIGTTFIV